MLEEALAIKNNEEQTEKAKILIESMNKNKKLVSDRLAELGLYFLSCILSSKALMTFFTKFR